MLPRPVCLPVHIGPLNDRGGPLLLPLLLPLQTLLPSALLLPSLPLPLLLQTLPVASQPRLLAALVPVQLPQLWELTAQISS